MSVEEAALAELGRGASRRSAKMLSDPGQLERAVMEGLEGPGWTPTAEEWQKKADDVIARHRRSNVG
ncbi:MAG: hypothetical protein R3B68_07905 [Phycisphaerales bacterium]